MIRHIVFFSAKSPEKAVKIRDGLKMLAGIPHVAKFEVALNRKTDPLSSGVDVVVYAEFADDAALSAYRAHPLYAKCVSVVKPLRDMRLSADIEAD
jgi:hypothetical protein